jgi:alcohol dehydrogenase (NADP+)
VHWPFPNFHPPCRGLTSRSREAKPYIHANYMKTWHKMESLVDLGLVRHIGTSNLTISKLKLPLRDAGIKPAVSEMELHPLLSAAGAISNRSRHLVIDHGNQAAGYGPIGSPGRPERDCTPQDTSPQEDPVVIEIASRHGTDPAVVSIEWAVQRGQIPILSSINHYRANLEGGLSGPPRKNRCKKSRPSAAIAG